MMIRQALDTEAGAVIKTCTASGLLKAMKGEMKEVDAQLKQISKKEKSVSPAAIITQVTVARGSALC